MKFSFIFNVLAFTGLSGLLASPANSDNYPAATPSPSASSTVVPRQESHDGSSSIDNSSISCQKNWENHYHQGKDCPDSNDENYPSAAETNPYYIWSPRPRWGRYSSLNRRDSETSEETSPYYIWSPRPRWGRYSAQNEADAQASSNGASPYYVWSPRPKWGRYSNDANYETYHSDAESNGQYSQQTNARYGYSASQRPARYSSGEHVQLHG